MKKKDLEKIARALDHGVMSAMELDNRELRKKCDDLSNDFLTVVALLDRNTKGGAPTDIDDGSCWLCEVGMDEETSELDLSVPANHKPDCAWREAREMLDPKRNAKLLAEAKP